ncbi:50S ribosomal protein L4 [Candidatus Vidania fulgoroideorum]
MKDIKVSYYLISKIINIIKSNKRLKISKQKTRGEINFSNIKPWKQKGTGRARVGSKSSPIWRKGGRCFSKSNISFKKKYNKKELELCKKMILIYFLKKKNFFIFKEFFNMKKILIVEKKESKLINKFKNYKFVNFMTRFDILKMIKNKYFLIKKNILNYENI